MDGTTSEAVRMPLKNLVDLAIGAPEVGAVNFNVLHTVLHIMVQQLNLSNTKVEFRGQQAERMEVILKSAATEKRIVLTEYMDTPETAEVHEPEKILKTTILDNTEDDKGKENPTEDEHEDVVEEAERHIEEVAAAEPQRVVVVRAVDDTVHAGPLPHIRRTIVPGPLMSPEGILNMQELMKLEERVSLLHQELARLQGLPTDEALLERIRSSAPSMVIEDMWKYINLEKRIEATEEAIEKLSSLTHTLVKDTDKNRIDIEELNKSLEGCLGQIEKHESGLIELNDRIEDNDTRDRREHAADDDDDAEEQTEKEEPPAQAVPSLEGMENDDKFRVIEYVLERLWQKVESLTRGLAAAVPDYTPDTLDQDIAEILAPVCREGADYDQQIEALNGRMEDIDQLIRGQLSEVQGRIDALERDLGVVMETVRTGMPIADTASQDLAGLSELYNKFQDMQREVNELTGRASDLEGDQQEKQAYLESLLEELQHIRMVKADKEELELALEKKADYHDVTGKVSRSQFETISEDLMRGIDQTLGRLTEQEVMWREALETMQMEMESKLGKDEVSPVQEFVNQKLKSIQEKLKALQAMREETEAAGIKKKLLRNVQCISCDKDVVMRRQSTIPSVPALRGLPPYRSIRPYLTYQLDKIRNQQIRLPNSRNLRQFEDVLNDHRARQSPRLRQQQAEICTEQSRRGGSHTVTNAVQRVRIARQPLAEYGPQVSSMRRPSSCSGSS